MIYLYGITDYSAAPLPDISGLGDAPLISLASRDVLAIYSQLVSSGGPEILLATQDNLLNMKPSSKRSWPIARSYRCNSGAFIRTKARWKPR